MDASKSRTTLWVLSGLATVLLVGLVGLVVQRTNTANVEDRRVHYVIPPGTQKLILAGQDPAIVPDVLEFTLGQKDILVVTNYDNVGHTFGPYFVAAGDTFEVQFYRAAEYSGSCSVHPDNQISIVVNRGASFFGFSN